MSLRPSFRSSPVVCAGLMYAGVPTPTLACVTRVSPRRAPPPFAAFVAMRVSHVVASYRRSLRIAGHATFVTRTNANVGKWPGPRNPKMISRGTSSVTRFRA